MLQLPVHACTGIALLLHFDVDLTVNSVSKEPVVHLHSSPVLGLLNVCTNLHGVISHTTEHFINAVVETSELAFLFVWVSLSLLKYMLRYQEGLL